jgi:hypothetical protein
MLIMALEKWLVQDNAEGYPQLLLDADVVENGKKKLIVIATFHPAWKHYAESIADWENKINIKFKRKTI